MEKLVKIIRDRMGRANVFVTFDLDVVKPAFGAGIDSPEGGDFTSRGAIDLIRDLKRLNFVGFHIQL